VYLLEVTTFTVGMDEGRGMKELERNFYRGKLVQSRYWRYLRFFADGRLLTLTTWRPPNASALNFAKAGGARAGSESAALKRLGGSALWGTYEVLHDDARQLVRLRAEAVVALKQYPRMRSSTVHFEFALAASGRGANNARLAVLTHYSSYLEDGSDVVEHAIPPPGFFAFVSFDAAKRASAAGGAAASGVDRQVPGVIAVSQPLPTGAPPVLSEQQPLAVPARSSTTARAGAAPSLQR
jgi:hypothetical protein